MNKGITLSNFNKIYNNGIQAIFDINLNIKEKDFIVFVGPSGSGKSTLLRMIAGLEDISSGSIKIDGKIANNKTPWKRGVSMVFQNYALYPHLSVYKNIRFPLENDKTDLWKAYKNNWVLKKEINNLKLSICGVKKERIASLLESEKLYIENKYKFYEDRSTILSKISQIKIERINKNKKLNVDSKHSQNNNKSSKEKNNHDYNINKQKLYSEYNDLKNNWKKLKNKKLKEISKLKNELKSEKTKEKFNKDKFNDKKNILIKNKKIFKPYSTWKKENDKKVRWAAEVLGLDNYIFRKPRDLSGGQRQRVALGRAMVRNPKIFMLDEPLSNLDAKLRSEMRTTITNLHKKMGATSIYVTHDQVEAMTMATKIVVLKDGFIQQVGKPEDVYHNPSNMFVASFIGSPEINFIKGKISNNKFISDEISFVLTGKDQKYLKSYKNKDVILGLRPEDMSVNRFVAETYKDTIKKFKIKEKELLGKDIILFGSIGKGKNQDRRIILKTSELIIDKNNEFEFSVDLNKLIFFDPKTTHSINTNISDDTKLALESWNKNEKLRNDNKKLLLIQKQKDSNKGIFKKIKKIIKIDKQKEEIKNV